MKTEMYRIVFSNDAKKDLKELSKKAHQAVKKLSKVLEEIQEHPRTGSSQSSKIYHQASHHCCDVGPVESNFTEMENNNLTGRSD